MNAEVRQAEAGAMGERSRSTSRNRNGSEEAVSKRKMGKKRG